MRILLVSQEYPPETGWGGIGTYAGVIAPALARAGHEVHVLSVVAEQARSDTVLDGVHVHRAPLRRLRGAGRALRMPATFRRLTIAAGVAREMRRLEGDFDVCEAPEWNAEGYFLSRRPQPPLVVRLHSGARQVYPVLGELNRDRRRAIRIEEAAVARAAVVTGTRSLLAEVDLAGLGISASRVREIVYPVPLAPRLGPPEGPPRVAFIGRFEERKGPDTLIRAVPELVAQVPEVTVSLRGTDTRTVAGESMISRLNRLADKLGVADRVELVDRWHPDAVTEEMRGAQVCAVPSRWESFGLVAAEAAARGRPVVASDIPGLDDVVTDGSTGRLVPVDDPSALAAALADLLLNPGRAQQLGTAAAADIADRCDPDRVAGLTIAAYELAVGGTT